MTPTTSKTTVNNDGQNGWTEYRRLVLAELERLSNVLTAEQATSATLQLSLTQAINSAKQIILDKLHEDIKNADELYDKKLTSYELKLYRRIKEVETRYAKQLSDLKKDLEKAEKKLEMTDKEVTSLRSKALVLGALAGFVVALGSLVVSIFIKK
jgi:hypothetical protein